MNKTEAERLAELIKHDHYFRKIRLVDSIVKHLTAEQPGPAEQSEGLTLEIATTQFFREHERCQKLEAEIAELKAERDRQKEIIERIENRHKKSDARMFDIVSEKDRDIAFYKAELSRLESAQLKPVAGPPNLEGVPDDALFLCFWKSDTTSKDCSAQWSARGLRARNLIELDHIHHHLGPITPPEQQELPKYSPIEALEDAVRLIEHLGGNAKVQKDAIEAARKAGGVTWLK